MAKARAIVKRRKAVLNIRKITQTMQLIATARYQRCLQRALATRPYAEHLRAMLRTVATQAAVDHPLLRENVQARRAVLLVLTSNRGLCGAYNASVLRYAMDFRQQLEGAGLEVELEVVGKKGISYVRFLGLPIARRITDIEDRIAFGRAADQADSYMRRYEAGELARVDVAFMRFHSMSLQRAEVMELLPILPPPEPPGPQRELEFSPPAQKLLARLVPQSVRVQLYQAYNDAILSEQVARMVAMKAATDAAGDMIKYLTRAYNRARQTQITLELADIVGGAEAVK